MTTESSSSTMLAYDDEAMVGSSSSHGSGAGGAAAAPAARQPSRFKGVVPQPNGRWGAQIYERHARVWLGTFPDEETAARAYDVAALRYRGREAAVNFPAAEERAPDGGELAFLAAHSKSEIVDMLRKHTYADELRQGLMRTRQPTPAWARAPLFQKTVTPSDVGKLNRLVVPKHHAEKHFPMMKHAPETAATTTGGSGKGKGVLLNFEDDGDGKVWRFRYSFWNSSQSYVLTKGWSRFVREKGIQAGDTVTFSQSAYGGPAEKQLLIGHRKMNKQRPPQEDEAAGADDALAVDDTRVVKLFGADIAVQRGKIEEAIS